MLLYAQDPKKITTVETCYSIYSLLRTQIDQSYFCSYLNSTCDKIWIVFRNRISYIKFPAKEIFTIFHLGCFEYHSKNFVFIISCKKIYCLTFGRSFFLFWWKTIGIFTFNAVYIQLHWKPNPIFFPCWTNRYFIHLV